MNVFEATFTLIGFIKEFLNSYMGFDEEDHCDPKTLYEDFANYIKEKANEL